MVHDFLGKPFCCANKKVAAAHGGIDKVDAQNTKGKRVVTLAFFGTCLEGTLNIGRLLHLAQQGSQRFVHKELHDPVGGIVDPMAVVLAILIPELKTAIRFLEVRPQQALVDVTQLAHFESAVVDGVFGTELPLCVARTSRRLGKNQLPENIGQVPVPNSPALDFLVCLRIEETAVVARDAKRCVLPGVGSVDKVEESK